MFIFLTALVYCWGLNGVISNELQHHRCTFMVTDETSPRPPSDCVASKNALSEITVTCKHGHDGGLQQVYNIKVYEYNHQSY